MKNPYLMCADSMYNVYSNTDTGYVSYVPSKNPYLQHGWGTDAASKLKQKIYNSKYYDKYKNLWKTKYYHYEKKGRKTTEDIKDTLSKGLKSYGENWKRGAQSISNGLSNLKKRNAQATSKNSTSAAQNQNASNRRYSGVAQDFTSTSSNQSHTYSAFQEFVADFISNGRKTRLIRNTIMGSAGIMAGAKLISVGTLTANPFLVAGGAALAAIGTVKALSAGKTVTEAVVAEVKASNIEKRKEAEPIDKKSGFHINTQNLSEEENLKAVNAKYKNLDLGTKNNCVLCSVTYELRQRGLDVTANTADQGYYMSDVNRWFPDAEAESIPPSEFQGDDFKKKCIAQGDGASGIVMVSWKKGGGHAMHYKVKNGKVIISDGQSSQVYDDISKLTPYIEDISLIRLDNQEPDYDAIRKEVCK